MNIFFITDEVPLKGRSGSSIVSWTWINFFLKQKHKIFIFIYPSRSIDLDKIFLKEANKFKTIKNLEIFFLKKQEIKSSKEFFKPSLKRYLNIEDEIYITKKLNKKIIYFKPDMFFLYGLFAIYISRNLKNQKRFAPMCENPLRISLAKFKFQMNLKNFIFRIYDLYRCWYLMKEISNIYNDCNLKGHSSDDFRKDFINNGVQNIKYYNHPYPNVPYTYKHKNYVDKKVTLLIVGALSTVNWAQFKIIQKYILKKLENEMSLNIEIRLVGSKKHKYFNKLYNSKFISCPGYVDKISDEFMNCDIFFSPTPIKLGLRVRLIEAMAYGKCLLVSRFDQEAFPLLTHNHNCYVIENIDDVFEDIKFLANDPELRNRLSMQAREDYLNFCSEDKSCSVYEKDIINLVINHTE